MAAFSSKTLIALFLLAIAIAMANQVVSQTITFDKDGFNPLPEGFILQGDAFVPPSSSSVRLTKVDASGNAVRQSVGRIVYAPPVPFWDTNPNQQALFETTIKFTITPVDSDPADGLTFFIIPVDSPIPDHSTGGNFGLFDPNTGNATVFAVEFDVYYKGDNTWDPPYPHIGIDINSRLSDKVEKFEDLALGEVVTARIDYEPDTRTITVVANYGAGKSVTLKHVFDIKTILPKQVQVGISASTGSSMALHGLHAWYFTSTLVRDKLTQASTNPYSII